MRSVSIVLILIFISATSFSQKLFLVPKAGINYLGASYMEKGDYKPQDFKFSRSGLSITIGADLKYKLPNYTHVLSIQSIALGTSWSFINMYFNAGIIPASSGHHMETSTDQTLISYGLEKETNNKGRIRGNYGLQLGFGFNKNKEYYDSIFTQHGYGVDYGTGYQEYLIQYKRGSRGLFLTAKAGISLYNKKNNAVVNLQAFLHQGFTKMISFDLMYRYGYYNYPQYQKIERVHFHSTGTVFGATVGVPIHILTLNN